MKKRDSRHDRIRERQEWEEEILPEDDAAGADEWDDDDAAEEKPRDRRKTRTDQPREGESAHPAIVLTTRGRHSTLLLREGEDRQIQAYRASDLQHVAGDEVTVIHRLDDSWWISAVGPRRTSLSRPDPHHGWDRLVMAANIDVVVHVSSAKSPPLRRALIDRFLVAIVQGGTEPVICVNKIDLLDEDETADLAGNLADYADLGIPIVFCSVKSRTGLDRLRSLIAGKVCAFVGHSGVGKSSLLNALQPEVKARVGAIQDRGGRGRHTTSYAAMYDLGEGTRAIDTPGIRELGLWDVEPAEIRFYFDEFEPYMTQCRFSDCTHLHEPGCAVKEAVEKGEIPLARYESYQRLTEEQQEKY